MSLPPGTHPLGDPSHGDEAGDMCDFQGRSHVIEVSVRLGLWEQPRGADRPPAS